MSKKPFFTGPFAPICESYVAQKRASGLDYNQQAKLLRLFDNFCKDYEIQSYTITKDTCANKVIHPTCFQPFPNAENNTYPIFFQRMSYISFLNDLTHFLRLTYPLTDILLCHSYFAYSMAVAFEFLKRWRY